MLQPAMRSNWQVCDALPSSTTHRGFPDVAGWSAYPQIAVISISLRDTREGLQTDIRVSQRVVFRQSDHGAVRAARGLSTKIHARVDHQGRPIQILITPGQAHDLTGAEPLLANLGQDTIIIADKAYDADRLRAHIKARGATANIPNMIRRKKRFRWTKALYRQRNHVERFFNKLKQFRRIATRYDKLGATFLAFIQLAAVRISLRSIESTT